MALILARNTISGQTASVTEKIFNHPVFGQYLEVAHSDKPVVIGKPRKPKRDGGEAIVETELEPSIAEEV